MNFLHPMAALGYLPKLQRDLGLTLVTFSAWFFFYKNVLYLILYQLTKFQRHNFFLSQDFKQNVLSSSYLDNWWRQKLEIYLRSSSKAMAAKEKKRGRLKNKTLNASRWKIDEIKSIFHNYLRTIIWWKNEN